MTSSAAGSPVAAEGTCCSTELIIAEVGGSSTPGLTGSVGNSTVSVASVGGCGENSNSCVVPIEASVDVSGLAVATVGVSATSVIGRA